MPDSAYLTHAPDRSEIDALTGFTVLEFGTDWCGHCRAARPHVAASIGTRDDWRHLRIEDGPGRALGRSYAVKRWPTLIFLHNGQELARLVRPTETEAINQAIAEVLKRLDG